MSQPRIKTNVAREDRKARAMFRAHRVQTIAVVVDKNAMGHKAVVAVALNYEKLASFLENPEGRELDIFDIPLKV